MFATLLLAAGCEGDSANEMWLVELTYERGEYRYTSRIEENFTDADYETLEEEDDEWDLADTYEYSSGLAFLDIRASGSGEAIAVFAGTIYTGTWADGEGSFELTMADHRFDQNSHETGYFYELEVLNEVVEVLELSIEGDSLQGTWEQLWREGELHTESDVWDDSQVGIGSGMTPSDSYLDEENTPENAECDDDLCTLYVYYEMPVTTTVVGVPYRGDVDESLVYATRPGGYPYY